jgi:hypothetical protein
MPKNYLRKAGVAARYKTTPRNVERLVKNGRLPAPEHPTSEKIPLWNEAKLDEHDEDVARRRAEHTGRAA